MAEVTWNPLDKGSCVVLSNNNLTAISNGSYGSDGVRATLPIEKGRKVYWECIYPTVSYQIVGVSKSSLNNFNIGDLVPTVGLVGYYATGAMIANGKQNAYTVSINGSANICIGVAVDMVNGILEFYKNGVYLGIAYSDLFSLGEIYPFGALYPSGASIVANFGSTPFKYPIPKGFSALQGHKVLLKTNNKYYSVKKDFYDISLQKYNHIIGDIDWDITSFSSDILFQEVTISVEEVEITPKITSNTTPILEQFTPIDKFDNFQLVTKEQPTSSINVLATKTNSELISSNGDIPTYLSQNIDFFKLTPLQGQNGQVKIVLSKDSGKTWLTYNITDGITHLVNTIPLNNYKSLSGEDQTKWSLAKTEIIEKGMDVATFNAFDFNLLEAKTIRFAYVLVKPTYGDKAETDKLEWQFDAKGYMKLMGDAEGDMFMYEKDIRYVSNVTNPIVKLTAMV